MAMVQYLVVLFETNDETVQLEYETTVGWGKRFVSWTFASGSFEQDDSKLYEQSWVPLSSRVGQYWFVLDSMPWLPIVVPDYNTLNLCF